MKKDRNEIKSVSWDLLEKFTLSLSPKSLKNRISGRRRRKIGREESRTAFDLFPPPIRSPEMHIDEGNSISESFPSEKVEKRLREFSNVKLQASRLRVR